MHDGVVRVAGPYSLRMAEARRQRANRASQREFALVTPNASD